MNKLTKLLSLLVLASMLLIACGGQPAISPDPTAQALIEELKKWPSRIDFELPFVNQNDVDLSDLDASGDIEIAIQTAVEAGYEIGPGNGEFRYCQVVDTMDTVIGYEGYSGSEQQYVEDVIKNRTSLLCPLTDKKWAVQFVYVPVNGEPEILNVFDAVETMYEKPFTKESKTLSMPLIWLYFTPNTTGDITLNDGTTLDVIVESGVDWR